MPDAVYEIKFQLPPSPHVVTSVSGRQITLSNSGEPTAFRTPAMDDPDNYTSAFVGPNSRPLNKEMPKTARRALPAGHWPKRAGTIISVTGPLRL